MKNPCPTKSILWFVLLNLISMLSLSERSITFFFVKERRVTAHPSYSQFAGQTHQHSWISPPFADNWTVRLRELSWLTVFSVSVGQVQFELEWHRSRWETAQWGSSRQEDDQAEVGKDRVPGQSRSGKMSEIKTHYESLRFQVIPISQEELKIDDDDFEDLQSLYQLFDLDKDGILSFKEYEKLLRCLGYRLGGACTKLKVQPVNVWHQMWMIR